MKHSRGFSLVGILVASALLGILAVVFSKMLTETSSIQKGIERGVEFGQLKTSLNMLLSRPDLCILSLKPLDASTRLKWNQTLVDLGSSDIQGVPLRAIQFGSSGSNLAKAGATLSGGLKVENIGLIPVTPDPIPKQIKTTLPGETAERTLDRAYAELYIKVSQPKKSSYKLAMREEARIPIELYYNPDNNNVLFCASIGSFPGIPEWVRNEDVCNLGEYMVGVGPDGPNCLPMIDPSNHFLQYSESPPDNFQPAICKFNASGGSIREMSCKHYSRGCQFTGGGWQMLRPNGQIDRPCSEGVTGTLPVDGEFIVKAKEALPAEVDVENDQISCVEKTRNTDCHITVRGMITHPDKTVGLANGYQGKTVCYRNSGNSLWYSRTFRDTDARVVGTRSCNFGMRITK